MTITPPRGAGGAATTRTARNRNRRRQNAAGEPRHAALNQAEAPPLRRRGGRHAAEDPVIPEEPGAAVTDVEFPAPAWDPWATNAGQALAPASITDPLEASGVVDGRVFWDAAPAGSGQAGTTGWFEPVRGAERGAEPSTWTDAAATGIRPALSWDDSPQPGNHAGAWTDAGATGIGAPVSWDDAAGAVGWTDSRHGSDHPGDRAHPGTWGDGTGRAAGWTAADATGIGWVDGDVSAGGTGWADSAVPGAGTDDADSPAGVTATPREPVSEPVGGADSDISGTRQPYRKRVEKDREAGRRRLGRRAHARRPRNTYLNAALVRCGLYLGPLSVAIAAAEPLGRVAWPVPAVILLLGWTAAQGLTGMGVSVARRGGPAAAARMVGAGFAAVIGLWCALVWVAPDPLLGPDRLLAATTGVGGLITLASVTAALVTRAEGAVAGWYVPCWLLAAAVLAEAGGIPEATLVPVQTLLPAVIVAVAIRAFRPAVLPAVLSTPVGPPPRLTAADRRRAVAYLVIGAAQALSVTLLWRGGPAVMPLPAALPLLLAVPLLEGLIGWHTHRLDAGLDSAESPEEFDRHVRNVTAITLAGLVPPLAAGCGLLVAAYRLPYGFSGVPGARDAVLALAAATLLGGVFAVTFLLAARSRHGIAATLAALPPLAAAVLAMSAPPAGLLPAAVAVLAATHLAGLLIVALTAADLRRTP
ncbi:hypothetical protein Ait01nite_003960 [Actinoplanes italicus]|uniref:Uncharacterized protein n=1 Tax=Actinoplanes italicus TaxID=113567 RepID=A0A2T0KMS6_9ACTN|nr:hypothetical protein [Actinoplanes italicus]PRX24922.1 hypothetical protein CLV67_102705 [Actinoplanes italicus]GIE27351.1 hypothetical protein Ait01nite_003960 [Actinoplanes italicus]